MSRSAFASRFAHLVGIPPIEYLASWRMTLAKSALASADMPMAEIAEMAGYQSVSAFSTAFKRETGYPPTLYVQSLRQARIMGVMMKMAFQARRLFSHSKRLVEV